ncbi:MAG TPA: energy transducer TonB [Dongiaceae bacterium]|nr:energy transducer TonB [Dongiaceae bacterium]
MISSHQPPLPASRLAGPSPVVREEISLPALTTLVVWTTVLTVGLLGLWLHYPRPGVPASIPAIQAELLQVKLTAAPPQNAAASREAEPAPETQLSVPLVPPLPQMAAPQPAAAFVVPVPFPATTTLAAATASGAATTATSDGNAVPELDWDHGDNQQPRPEYPRRAVLEGQQGTVQLRFRVDATGRVATVEITDPSPWPLLNQAAETAIRETWRFRPGRVRWFKVPIRFRLED